MEYNLPSSLVKNLDFGGEAKDRVIMFAAADVIRKVEKLFSVQLEYF